MDPAEIRLIKLAFESIREPSCFLNCHLGNQLTSAQWSLFRLWQLEKKLRRFVNTITPWPVPIRQSLHIAQFTKTRSIHCGFYKWKTMDDNKKMFTPQLAFDTKIFHCTFVNPWTMYNQRRSRNGVRFLLCIWPLTRFRRASNRAVIHGLMRFFPYCRPPWLFFQLIWNLLYPIY